ncbi:prolyl aminopeptidase, partial [Actinomyces urogenitalis]|nr:prolyl aminopeptidase [Actinomyces urogenitalis]
SADRLAEEIPGFAKDADPLDESEPYYLSGEHMMRSFFDEDPFLRPFAKACDILATRTDWPAVYIPEVLTHNTVPVAAAVYYDDM